jgi:excisionase family DNA binding protein
MPARPNTRAPEPAPLVNISTVADYLGMCQKSVRNMVQRGELIAYRIAGTRTLRFDMNEVVALARPIPTAAKAGR